MIWYILAFTISLLGAWHWSQRRLDVKRINYNNYLEFMGRDYNNVSKYLIIFLIAFLPMFIMAVRYDVGTDYLGTYTIDFWLINNGYATRNEPLSVVLYKFAGLFSDNVQSYFIITSVLCVLCTYIGIYKLSVKPIYSIVLYFTTYQYFTAMNAVRQMVATTIVFAFIPYLLKQKYGVFTLGVIFAGLIHYAAFLYLILIPLFLFEINYKKSLFVLLALFGAIQIFRNPIYVLIEKTPYAHYLVSSVEYGASAIFIIVNLLVYLIMILNYRNSERYKFWMNIQMIIILVCMIQNIIPLAGRVVQLFSFYRMIIIPEISVNIKAGKTRWLFTWGISIFYAMYCIYGLLIANWDHVLPYQAFFMF